MLDQLSKLRKYTAGYEDMAKQGAAKAKSIYQENFANRSIEQAGRELYDKGRRKFTDEMLRTDAADDRFLLDKAYNFDSASSFATSAAGIGMIGGATAGAVTGDGFGDTLMGAVGGAAIATGSSYGMNRRQLLRARSGSAKATMTKAQDNMSKFQSELDSVQKAKARDTSPFPFVGGAQKRRFNDRIANLQDNIKAEGKIVESNKKVLSGEYTSPWKFGAVGGGGILAHNILDGNDPI